MLPTIAIGVIVFSAALAFYVHYLRERRAVLQFVSRATEDIGLAKTVDVVLRLASHVHFRVPRQTDDPAFLWPLPSLGATPGMVLHDGGCCSGLSRLLIVALDAAGITATQITLNHRSQHYRHCLVEARVGGQQVVLVDPKYGMYYCDASGRFIGLEDLQAGVEPSFRPIPGRKQARYPRYDIYDWDYSRTGTANWVKSAPRRMAYRVLRRVTGGKIDRWRQPACLEWPQLVLCGTCLILGSAIIIALAMIGGPGMITERTTLGDSE